MPTIINCQRRQLLKASVALVLVPGFAKAQTFPAKPIKLVVPFPPGGLIDTMAMLVSARLALELGQPVVIDNKPGAGGNLGAAEVARSTPDGYTLLMASPRLTISPALYAIMPYKPEQITPVGSLSRVPNVLLVNSKRSINSVAELLVKAKSMPGKLNYASSGNGTSLHLSAELFKSMIVENLQSVIGQIQGDSVKALAVTTRTRSKTIASVPTLVESGFPDFDVSSWYGLTTPAGTPAAVIARVEVALQKITRDADIVRSMESRGADVGFLNAQLMGAFMSADAAKWKRDASFAKTALG